MKQEAMSNELLAAYYASCRSPIAIQTNAVPFNHSTLTPRPSTKPQTCTSQSSQRHMSERAVKRSFGRVSSTLLHIGPSQQKRSLSTKEQAAAKPQQTATAIVKTHMTKPKLRFQTAPSRDPDKPSRRHNEAETASDAAREVTL